MQLHPCGGGWSHHRDALIRTINTTTPINILLGFAGFDPHSCHSRVALTVKQPHLTHDLLLTVSCDCYSTDFAHHMQFHDIFSLFCQLLEMRIVLLQKKCIFSIRSIAMNWTSNINKLVIYFTIRLKTYYRTYITRIIRSILTYRKRFREIQNHEICFTLY